VPEYDVTVAAEPLRSAIPVSGLITYGGLTAALPPPAVWGSVVPSGPITAIDVVVAVLSGRICPVF